MLTSISQFLLYWIDFLTNVYQQGQLVNHIDFDSSIQRSILISHLSELTI